MSPPLEPSCRLLLEAIAFAARAHRHQVRKDNQTPYASHAFRVCLVLRDVFGVEDRLALTAAVLHDTIEDTTTDYDDLAERFGAAVAGWVAALTKDKRLPEPAREEAYCRQFAQAPWQVQVCKLADIFDNLMDLGHLRPDGRTWALARMRAYLDALRPHLAEQAKRPWEIVNRLLAEAEAKA
jgi:guanosine-3',5'-bis(diphosphate) 3'-pyrophosphohydrolase